jgi:hypothetical protein
MQTFVLFLSQNGSLSWKKLHRLPMKKHYKALYAFYLYFSCDSIVSLNSVACCKNPGFLQRPGSSRVRGGCRNIGHCALNGQNASNKSEGSYIRTYWYGRCHGLGTILELQRTFLMISWMDSIDLLLNVIRTINSLYVVRFHLRVE